jgi:hypothetical protein
MDDVLQSVLTELVQKYPNLTLDVLKLAEGYYKKFGYLNGGQLSPDDFFHATKEFQEYFGLEADAEFGPKTFRAMHSLRCGVSDHLKINAQEAKWRKRELTYFVESYDSDLSKSRYDEIVQQAFDQWVEVADLKITRGRSAATCDILIGAGSGRQDDFDGASGVLAWCELPNGTDRQILCKVDLAETWIDSPTKRGILLLNVLCHEFGHGLGLEHSRIQSALMAPYYAVGVSKPQQNDDVTRIQTLYGPPQAAPTPPTAPTPSPTEMSIVISGKGPDKLQVAGWRCSKLS